MARIAYIKKNFQQKTLDVIEQAVAICEEYARQGYSLTLRQLYYQFVSRDLLQNNQRNYNRLGEIVNDARYAGLLDWNFIVDRTRDYEQMAHWADPNKALTSIARQYQNFRWNHQPYHVEVWIEKDALVGVLEAVCPDLDVGFFSCRGYTSSSEMWSAAQRHRRAIDRGHQVLILHLGDHDPSGVNMSLDIEERLRTFIYNDWYRSNFRGLRTSGSSTFRAIQEDMALTINDERADFRFDQPELDPEVDLPFEVRRIALNMDQVEQYDPPPNFAKVTDSRYEKYVEQFGVTDSWELDALPPEVLTALISEHVEGVLDEDIWSETTEEMEEDREIMLSVAARYSDVKEFIASNVSMDDVRRLRDDPDGPDDPTDPKE